MRKDEKNRFDLVNDPRPDTGVNDGWWIRANQGHSMQVCRLELSTTDDYLYVYPRMLKSPTHLSLRRTRSPWPYTGQIDVHGRLLVCHSTFSARLPAHHSHLATQGLSRMKRTHIHLAQGVPGSGVISGTYVHPLHAFAYLNHAPRPAGMRSSADILIHVDLAKALAAGVPFFLSSNGVVLTPGDARGFLAPEFFSRVEARKGKALPGWESTGREVFAVPSLSQEAEADVSPSVATAKEDSEVIAETAMEDTSAFAQKEGEAITKAPPAP